MAKKGESLDFYWPRMQHRAHAEKVMKNGAISAWIIAFLTLCLGAYTLFAHPGTALARVIIMGSAVDVVLFAAIGFAIWRYSLVAACAGFAFFVLERAYQWSTHFETFSGVGFGLAVTLAFGLFNAIRGGIALRRFRREEVEEPVVIDVA
ncbi:MAG: hypothetical protein WBW32_09580 [Luteibacter sp.]